MDTTKPTTEAPVVERKKIEEVIAELERRRAESQRRLDTAAFPCNAYAREGELTGIDTALELLRPLLESAK